MTYWPWYIGGLALTGVMLLHWVVHRRMMAVSGRFTAIVNRVRFGKSDAGLDEAMSHADMVAAMQAATEMAFGATALDSDAAPAAEPELATAPSSAPPFAANLVFLACLIAGGFLSAALAGDFAPALLLRGTAFSRLVHGSPATGACVLLVGGLLVGFGTRMAGGCTSGHGLCGVSRLQKGSLLATAAFFGMGVATSLLLGRLL